MTSVLVCCVAFLIARVQGDPLAWKDLGVALLSSGIVLAGFAVWHLFRTPWLLHKNISGGEKLSSRLYGTIGSLVALCLLVSVVLATIFMLNIAENSSRRPDVTAAAVGPTAPPKGQNSDLHPAALDHITLTSEFDFPAFEAKCTVPCFFYRGVVIGSESKIEALPQGKDPTIAGARVVVPVRLREGQQITLEYMAKDGGPISLVWGGRHFSAPKHAMHSKPNDPCPHGGITFNDSLNVGTGTAFEVRGNPPCPVTINRPTVIGGKKGLLVDPTKSKP